MSDLRDRIARARSVVGDHSVVDPYVLALAELSILAEQMLVVGDRWRAGDADLDDVDAAESDLRAALPMASSAVIERVKPSRLRRLLRWLSW